MEALSDRLYVVALVVLPTTRFSMSVSVRMSLNVNWARFIHLCQHQRVVVEHMAQILGDQALTIS